MRRQRIACFASILLLSAARAAAISQGLSLRGNPDPLPKIENLLHQIKHILHDDARHPETPSWTEPPARLSTTHAPATALKGSIPAMPKPPAGTPVGAPTMAQPPASNPYGTPYGTPHGTPYGTPFGAPFIQTVQTGNASLDQEFARECNVHLQGDDFEIPLQKAGKHKDRYCYFSSAAPWAKECAVARMSKDYLKYASAKGAAYKKQLHMAGFTWMQGPPDLLAVHYGGGMRTLVTQLNQWPLEDVYCAANGWMDMPAGIVANRTKLEEVASLQCQALLIEHPGFQRMSMGEVLALTAKNANDLMLSVTGTSAGPTMTELKYHAISRCLLGGLECDIANCAINFCRRHDLGPHFIGHTDVQCGVTKLDE